MESNVGAEHTIVVVGGGFSGALFALKMAKARPQARIVLVERERRLGRGIAYGACGPEHLLNVPVSRMEVGLTPRFAEWLAARRDPRTPPGDLSGAFAPRALFGDYLEEQVRAALSISAVHGPQAVRGEAVGLLDAPAFGLQLWDGRKIAADVVVLATGNLPPRPPALLASAADDGALFVPDPWARDAFDALDPDAPVLLVGTGLTMVDVALRLEELRHRGPLLAVSRHGLLPQPHRSGGAWPAFLDGARPASPSAMIRLLRSEARRAEAAGIPWQRVLDAARPSAATVWHGWSTDERRGFLRHLRAYWDVHRHRMAPAIADRLTALVSSGRLRVEAGRIAHVARAAGGAEAMVTRRRGGTVAFRAARIINCTGPRTDFDELGIPLFADLRRRGLLRADALGLGVESAAGALVDDLGTPSRRLFALGPLTRPAYWEVTAVPEIAVQIEDLVARLSSAGAALPARSLPQAFNEIGAGI